MKKLKRKKFTPESIEEICCGDAAFLFGTYIGTVESIDERECFVTIAGNKHLFIDIDYYERGEA